MTTRHTIMGSIKETLEAGEQNSIDERENILKRLRTVIWKHIKEKGLTVPDGDGIASAKSNMSYRFNKVVEFKRIAHIANIIWIQRASLGTIDDFFDESDPVRNIEKQICRLKMMIRSHIPCDINNELIIINGEEVPLPASNHDMVQITDVNDTNLRIAYHKYLGEIEKYKRQIQSLQYTRAHPFVTAMMMKFPLLEDNHELYPSGSPLLCVIPETVASQQGVYLQKVDVSMTLPPSESESNDNHIPEAYIGEYNQLFLKPTTRTMEDGTTVTCISE